jgi:hypothetical protein
MGLLIEQQLVALSEAIKHKSFEMDADRIRNLLMEAGPRHCRSRLQFQRWVYNLGTAQDS